MRVQDFGLHSRLFPDCYAVISLGRSSTLLRSRRSRGVTARLRGAMPNIGSAAMAATAWPGSCDSVLPLPLGASA